MSEKNTKSSTTYAIENVENGGKRTKGQTFENIGGPWGMFALYVVAAPWYEVAKIGRAHV